MKLKKKKKKRGGGAFITTTNTPPKLKTKTYFLHGFHGFRVLLFWEQNIRRSVYRRAFMRGNTVDSLTFSTN